MRQTGSNLGRREGLQNVVCGPVGEAFHEVLFLSLRREEEHGQARDIVPRAHRIENREAAHTRHHDVEEHDVGFAKLPNTFKGFLAARGLAYPVAEMLNLLAENVAVDGLVVDHEDVQGH